MIKLGTFSVMWPNLCAWRLKKLIIVIFIIISSGKRSERMQHSWLQLMQETNRKKRNHPWWWRQLTDGLSVQLGFCKTTRKSNVVCALWEIWIWSTIELVHSSDTTVQIRPTVCQMLSKRWCRKKIRLVKWNTARYDVTGWMSVGSRAERFRHRVRLQNPGSSNSASSHLSWTKGLKDFGQFILQFAIIRCFILKVWGMISD